MRDLDKVDLAAFPSLTHFHMEDQLKMQALDLRPVSLSLRWMTAWNCKNLENLVGIEAMNALQFLWIGKTKIDPEKVVPRLPTSIRQATVAVREEARRCDQCAHRFARYSSGSVRR